MRVKVILGVLAVAVLLWSRASGQVQPSPGPGTGIVTVRGSVAIDNVPAVEAVQRGPWTVSVNSVPPVPPLPFLKLNVRYQVEWGQSEREVIRVLELGPRGWVRVEDRTRPRWVNLDAAQSVYEER